MAETVLIIGASGNIGVSAIVAAIRTGRNVIAVVRNQAAADKMFQHAGTQKGITAVFADPTKEGAVAGIVERVRKGELPAFHHVFVSVGRWGPDVSVANTLTVKEFREAINIALESSFCKSFVSSWCRRSLSCHSSSLGFACVLVDGSRSTDANPA
jgi:NAD(P)-dependent dehydrogenase (short-subunit alcohol dehydrogenase family)